MLGVWPPAQNGLTTTEGCTFRPPRSCFSRPTEWERRGILLASDSVRFPDGMVNSSGLVGRRLMVHPLAVVKGLFREDVQGWRGHAGASIVSFQFYASDERRGFIGGAKWALSPGGGPLRAALTEGGEWGAEHHRHVRERFGRSAHWGLVCEDLPREDNRIELSRSLADSSGMPAPRMVYRIR